jgi:hypothetical protein
MEGKAIEGYAFLVYLKQVVAVLKACKSHLA